MSEFKPYKEGVSRPSRVPLAREAFRRYEAVGTETRNTGWCSGSEVHGIRSEPRDDSRAFHLDVQLEVARDILMDYMQKFGLKPVDVRISHPGLFDALRVYDAITYGGVRPTDVAKELEPAAFEQMI